MRAGGVRLFCWQRGRLKKGFTRRPDIQLVQSGAVNDWALDSRELVALGDNQIHLEMQRIGILGGHASFVDMSRFHERFRVAVDVSVEDWKSLGVEIEDRHVEKTKRDLLFTDSPGCIVNVYISFAESRTISESSCQCQ